MTSNADQPITALRTGHDGLAEFVRSLPPAAIEGPSGATEWTFAQVLSHLGSGAEINLATLDATLGGQPPAPDLNQQVWARWDAMAPRDQADGFLTANETLVKRYEAIDDDTRNNARMDLGFTPAPVDLATVATFRLNEFTLHSWDVRVVTDPRATLAPDAVGPLLGLMPFMMGWLGKPGSTLAGRAVTVAVHTTSPDTDFGLDITDKVAIIAVPEDPDASLTLPAETWIRLATGRLRADTTPDNTADKTTGPTTARSTTGNEPAGSTTTSYNGAEVTVAGAVSLDELRQVFPGF